MDSLSSSVREEASISFKIVKYKLITSLNLPLFVSDFIIFKIDFACVISSFIFIIPNQMFALL